MSSQVGASASPLQSIFQQALALHQTGRLSEAEGLYRQILQVQPDHVLALHYLSILAFGAGKCEIAAELMRRVVSLKPDFVEAHYNLGNALVAQGKQEEALASYGRALALAPDYTEAHYNVGLLLQRLGKPGEAVASYRRALALKPDYVEALNNLSCAFMDQGKIEDAVTIYRQVLTLMPDNVEVLCDLSKALSDMGELEEAARFLHQALTLKPDYAEAYRMLSLIEKHVEYDDDVKAKEALFRGRDLSDEAKIHLGFALGRIFEDLKQYDRSFDFIVKANQLLRGSYEYSIQSAQDFFTKIENTFSAEFITSLQGSGDPDETPFFIVGMPRSGTTLVEQILASHPLVFGGGEVEDFGDLVADYCPGELLGQFPESVSSFETGVFEKMGADYIVRIRRHSQEAEYITDKNLHNFLFVGLIRVMLPNAKIIHCRRDPMDNCLSIFKNYFTKLRMYAHDMTELGNFYRLYRGLMAHWERVLPGFMYTLNYDDLVSDQRGQTAKLLEFCGLPWDDACLDFHKTKRVVQTASFAQVRQPLYNDSVKLWKRYEVQLEPLRKALEG